MDLADWAFESLLTIGLLAVCSIGPGLFFVRRFRWPPLEALCASFAASALFVSIGSAAIYWLGLVPVASWHWGLTAICVALDIACWRDFVRLWRRSMSRRALGLLGLTSLYIALLLLVIRSYGGGAWWGDWLEHYQRSRFFVERWPLDFQFLNFQGYHYGLSDRPPLMNLICAHYLAETDGTYVTYQWIAAFLNILPALACCLFATSVGARGRVARRSVWAVLAVVLIASPIYVQNATYAWTKSFAAFFAMLGLWFYVRGWMKSDGRRIVTGFVFASAGCVVHMSVSPVAIALAGHYVLAAWWRRPARFRELATIVVLSAALPLSWWGWSAWTFGPTAASGSRLFQPLQGGKDMSAYSRIKTNTISTFVPYFLLRAPMFGIIPQKSRAGLVRDLAFELYQVNATFAIGSTGAAVLLYAIWSGGLRWRIWPARLRGFWVVFLFASIGLGLCIVPRPEAWGAAQLCMLPQIFLALSAAAGVIGALPIGWKRLVVAGLVLDFALGVLLQIHLERRTFGVVVDPDTRRVQVADQTLSASAVGNDVLKVATGTHFIGDFGGGGIIEIGIVAMFTVLLLRMCLRIGLIRQRCPANPESATVMILRRRPREH